MKIKIERLGMNGEGIGKIPDGENKGKIAFVDFALPGEEVEIEIKKSTKNYCECENKKVYLQSSDRETPKCKYFGKCGGCDLQHMSEHLQKTFKENKLQYVLNQLGFSKKVELFKVNSFNYRNKMVFPVESQNNIYRLGMFQKNSHDIVDIDSCMLALSEINDFYKLSKEYLEKNQETLAKLKYLVVRAMNNKFLIAVISKEKVQLNEYVDYLKDKINDFGLVLIISDSDNEILSGKMQQVYGTNAISLNEFGIDYKIDIMSFLQVNTAVKQELYKKVLEYIEKVDRVIDAYSGAGLLSGIVAKKCKKVVGIEINRFAVNSANILKSENNIENLQNICADTGKVLKKICESDKFSTIILDPARSGCSKNVTEFLADDKCSTQKIIYISCNLATLNRDLKAICNNYEIKDGFVFDMFPQSHHCENLIILEKKI